MKEVSLKTFLRNYPNDDACLDEIMHRKYPNGVFCNKCQKITAHFKLKGRTAYSCTWCRNQIFPLVGTIFEHSSISLRLWFYALFLVTKTRAGISAKQLERELGVCYKTAHRMMKMIRSRMNETDGGKLTGIVEVDSSYFGGKGANRAHVWHGNEKRKTAVMGMLQRNNGKAYMKKIKEERKDQLIPHVLENIDTKAHVMTDEHPAFKKLYEYGYFNHHAVNHANKEYVRKHVFHTNSIEGLWGRIKPAIKGVYRKVTPEYIESYMDEYCFRYNHRKEPQVMFDLLLERTTL